MRKSSGNVTKLVIAATMLLSMTVRADTPARPSGYSMVVGEHDQYLFVMLVGRCNRHERLEFPLDTADLPAAVAPHPRMAEVRFRLCREDTLRDASTARERNGVIPVDLYQWEKSENQQGRGREKDPRLDSYPYPGLYRNDATPEPLWTVDFYAGVDVSDDGRHLVRHGSWGGPLGVAFYDRGELLRAYEVTELVSDMKKLSYSVSHYMWIKQWNFSGHANRLRLATLAGDQHVFDVATGELLQSRMFAPPRIGAVITLLNDHEQSTLTEIRLCGYDYRLKQVTVPGADAPYRLMVTRGHRKSGEDAQQFDTMTIPLGVVSGLTRDAPRGDDETALAEGFWFRLQLRDGSLRRVAVARALALCGLDGEGDAREFAFAGLEQVRFCKDGDSVICAPR